MPRIFSYTLCHYGVDYISSALKSVYPFVEKSYILYTPHPSHGHNSELRNPETREEVMGSIDDWSKLTWVDTEGFWMEGPQRDYAVRLLTEAGADVIINLDYDEIHYPDVLERMIREVWDKNKVRNHLVNMIHFWRSFNLACTDDGWPVRFIDTRHQSGTNYLSPGELGKVLHFGYAIKTETLKYKMSLHGHKDEWRKDWLGNCWEPWPPGDNVHPTNDRKANGEGWWNPKPFDKNLLPEILKSHKWFNLEKID